VQYAYDALDRLTGISGGTTASYAYNGDGLRLQATVGGVTTTSVWDLATKTPELLSDGTNDFVYGLGLLGQFAASQTYAHTDQLGSVRLTTDSSGATTGTAQYDAFGLKVSQSGAQPKLGFAGEQMDTESLLVYLRARYMDPTTGRFLSADPVRGSQSWPATQNRYSYAVNNPQRYTDPTGMSIWGEIGMTLVFPGAPGGPYGHLALRFHINGIVRTYEATAQRNGFPDILRNPGGIVALPPSDGTFFNQSYDWANLCEDDQACADRLSSLGPEIFEIIGDLIDRINCQGRYEMNCSRIPYDIDGPNSNSYILAILLALGIDPKGDPNDYFNDMPVKLRRLLGFQVSFPGWKRCYVDGIMYASVGSTPCD
jgi:RHS repeat-associated protein